MSRSSFLVAISLGLFLGGAWGQPPLPPVISALSPPAIGTLTPTAPPVILTVTGAQFHAGSVVYSDNAALPTSFVSSTTLTTVISGTLPQAQVVGAVTLAVVNSATDVSNGVALPVGGASNQGTMVRVPIIPAPGNVYSVTMENGAPGQPFSIVVDGTLPAPIAPWPSPTENFVLSVRPLGPGAPLWIAFGDGIGLYGPSIPGSAFDGTGTFIIPAIVRPNPSPNFIHTVQGVFVDPTAPTGFRLMWPRVADVY